MYASKYIALVAFCSASFAALGQTTAAAKDDDTVAIRQAALNYIEGWYSGDSKRMESALHPELAKRMVSTDAATGKSVLNQMGALTLVHNTARGNGTHVPQDQQLKQVTILDVDHDAASVKINAASWIDYLQLARWNGEWKIVNVLWEIKKTGEAQRIDQK